MRRVLLLLSMVLAFAGRAAGAAIVDARDAADHVGSNVTVEGDVAEARSEAIGLVLELAPGGSTSVRVVLVPSLISNLPRSPERIYAGKRVRVTGRLQKFKGRPEMVIESPGQIEIVDVAGAPVSTTTTTTVVAPRPTTTVITLPPATTTTLPAAEATRSHEPPAPIVPAPTPAPAARAPQPAPRAEPPPPPAPAPPPPPPPPAAEPEPEPAPRPLFTERLAAQACERARTRWHDAAARTREATAALDRCLDAAQFACHAQAAALAPILSDLEWAEQEVADRCD